MNDLPKMPEGYYHLQVGSDRCYVLMDIGAFMKRLQTKDGHEIAFPNPRDAAKYAQKHKAAGLKFDQEVEVES